MEESKKVYWKGIEQLANSPEFVKHAPHEFAQPGPEEDLGHSRRDFLKMMGFGMSAVALAACEAPVRKSIPYVNKPMDTVPSIPDYFASTYTNGGEYCSILVKTREGRPIKIEGNALSKVTNGGTNAQVEASVLSLYDNARLRGPKSGTKRIDWGDLDSEIIGKLNEISAAGGQIRIVSNTILSPSTLATIERFRAKYPTAQLVQYDQVSAYGMLKANEESFGSPFIPSYDFSKANIIVGIGADFLGCWLSSTIEFTQQYARTREVSEDKKDMSRHYQFETVLSITGANADYRTQIKPSQEGAAVIALYNLIAGKAGSPTISGGDEKIANLAKAADDLWTNRGRALVVSGSNDKAIQTLVNGINMMLGSYGGTIDTNIPLNYKKGDDAAMAAFVNDAEAGRISAVIFYNCNPVYDYPSGDKIGAAIKNIGLSISTNIKEDETASLVTYKAPDHHFLESWNDAEPKRNHFSLAQPAITPIFRSRAAQESFLSWAGEPNPDYFEFVRNTWQARFFGAQSGSPDFQSFWDKCLYDGVFDLPISPGAMTVFNGDVNAAAAAIGSNYKAGKWEAVVYESGNIGNGSQANNPLLQELPDPITKVVWDHYVTVAPKDAKEINFSESFTKFANIKVNGKTVKLPVMIQPGQAPGTIGIPLGYGRTKAGKVADNRGENAYPMVSLVNGSLSYSSSNVEFAITDDSYQLAQTQTHNTYMGRNTVIQETDLASYKSGTKYPFDPKIATWKDPEDKTDPELVSIWKGHDYPNHHWGMSIDLNTCIGCGSCIVACNVENNVALVGRDEVIARREMHWLRIDRYYSSDAAPDNWRDLEEASENPEVVFQPMLCQHCNNAPCETVCPVAATTHSSEGLNQMTYNRCIGTRYCANNCPYKVRRFNWVKYHDNREFENVNPAMNTDLGKMVLNPDVTVRSRGVMEKCTFCVQRIQLGKLNARKERRRVKDGEVVTACQAACATGAIVFGDMNDPQSKIANLLKIRPLLKDRPTINDKESDNPRAYQVLEEIGVKPNIWYLRKVRNKDAAKA